MEVKNYIEPKRWRENIMGSIERRIIKRFIDNIFKEQVPQKDEVKQPDKSYKEILQEGKIRKAGETFEEWKSRYLNLILEQLPKTNNPIDKHFIYMRSVEHTYRERKDNRMRKLFKRIAIEHISEFDTFAEAWRRKFRLGLPQVPTFQYLTTVHTEDGEYDKAIAVCRKAMAFSLHDGTKSGFQGRIERIRKKRDKTLNDRK